PSQQHGLGLVVHLLGALAHHQRQQRAGIIEHELAHKLVATLAHAQNVEQAARLEFTVRQPVSSHSRSNTSAGPMRRLATSIALASAMAESTSALLAKRAPDRNSRSSCPLSCSSSYRPSVAITCWRT